MSTAPVLQQDARQRLLTGREVAYPLSPEQKEDLLERLFLHRDETLAGSFLWNGPSALRFRRVPASAHHGVLEVRKGWHWSGGDRFPHVTMELFAHDVNGNRVYNMGLVHLFSDGSESHVWCNWWYFRSKDGPIAVMPENVRFAESRSYNRPVVPPLVPALLPTYLRQTPIPPATAPAAFDWTAWRSLHPPLSTPVDVDLWDAALAVNCPPSL